MKGISAFLLSLGLLVAAGMLFTTHRSPAAPVTSKTTVKWEYKIVMAADIVEEEEDDVKALVKALNKLGDEGWELAVLSHGHFLFKRLK